MATLRPVTIDDALAALAAGPGKLLAGGTDVYAAAWPRLAGPVVDLSRVAGLSTIEAGADGWRIGAGVTWSALRAAPLPSAFDALKAAAAEVGSVQIQNRATLAGNLCNASPAADGVPALLALNAAVELAAAGRRRRLPLADFIFGPRRTALQPGEMVTTILVPPQPEGAAAVFHKLGARHYLVISIAMVAVMLAAEGGRITDARIAVGACSPVALRLAGLEAKLVGAPLERAGDCAGADDLAPLSPIDDVRATAAYRREAALVLVRRALAEAAGRLAP